MFPWKEACTADKNLMPNCKIKTKGAIAPFAPPFPTPCTV